MLYSRMMGRLENRRLGRQCSGMLSVWRREALQSQENRENGENLEENQALCLSDGDKPTPDALFV